MRKYYTYAGLYICIDIDDEYMYDEDYSLCEFRVESLDEYHLFRFKVVDELDRPRFPLIHVYGDCRIYEFNDYRELFFGSVETDVSYAYMKVIHSKNSHYVEIKRSAFKKEIPVHTVFKALDSERMIASLGGIMLHSSYILYNNEAILFTAPSGTGKSTQASLWNKYRNAEIVNGDRTGIREENGQIVACGLPFSGSSKISKNITVPIKAIVYLTQAKENTITELKGYKAFKALWEGSGVNTWDKKNVENITSVIENIISHVPIYQLNCTPDIHAIETLEEKLGG